MILRLLTAQVADGQDGEVLRRLRSEVVPSMAGLPGLRALTHGFRHEGSTTRHLALSAWDDFDAILRLAGSLDRPVAGAPLEELLHHVRIDHFELIEPLDAGVVDLDGPVISLVRGALAPNSDAQAIDMIRNTREEVTAAGVLALHLGRRIHERRTEIVVLAVWRDRSSLRRFARDRPTGPIDPAFIAHLTSWSFETYDCLGLGRIEVPAAGPAVLLADDEGAYVDASPGVEAVLGIPGELLLHRSVAELTGPERQSDFGAAWAAFLRDRHQEGTYALRLPDGRDVTVRFRAVADVPEIGLHASVLTLPDTPDDGRPVHELVAEAFSEPADPPAASVGGRSRAGR